MLSILSMPEVEFPKNFLWGAATAGHQIEGDNVNCQNYAFEIEGNYAEKSAKACNHWELYREDVKLLAKLGIRAYRMSVEWSRIEPERGKRDQKALARYCDLMARLKKEGINVFVTLHHFTHPLWFHKLGGFEKRENIAHFEKHLKFLVPLISKYVDGWNVFNEFNMDRDLARCDYKANMLIAHAKGYRIIKRLSKAPVSTAHALIDFHPHDQLSILDRTTAELADWLNNEYFFHAIRTGDIVLPYRDVEHVPELKGAMDFWAMNYYTRHFVSARMKNAMTKRHACNRVRMIPREFYLEEMYPEGLINLLGRLKDRPVYITENGCSCDDDRLRLVYITRYLHALSEAIGRGVDVRGYFYWSLMDNYEWSSFLPRFGLVDVDFKTFKRTPKQSAKFYTEIIKNNGITRKMHDNYLKPLTDFKAYEING